MTHVMPFPFLSGVTCVLAKLERPKSLEERHEARVLDVAGAPVAVDGEVGEAGGAHVPRAGLVVREAVLVHVTAAVDLQALRVGLGLTNPNPNPNPDPYPCPNPNPNLNPNPSPNPNPNPRPGRTAGRPIARRRRSPARREAGRYQG